MFDALLVLIIREEYFLRYQLSRSVQNRLSPLNEQTGRFVKVEVEVTVPLRRHFDADRNEGI